MYNIPVQSLPTRLHSISHRRTPINPELGGTSIKKFGFSRQQNSQKPALSPNCPHGHNYGKPACRKKLEKHPFSGENCCFLWQITIIMIPQVLAAPHFAGGVHFQFADFGFTRTRRCPRSSRNELASPRAGDQLRNGCDKSTCSFRKHLLAPPRKVSQL